METAYAAFLQGGDKMYQNRHQSFGEITSSKRRYNQILLYTCIWAL